MTNHPHRSKRPKWLLIADAPIKTHGLIWGPALGDRTDMAGYVVEYPDGDRMVVAQSATITFTHWHPLPSPPSP